MLEHQHYKTHKSNKRPVSFMLRSHLNSTCLFRVMTLVYCCLYSSLSSQNLTLSTDHYSIEEGLSHRQVNAIYQDQQGFIWVGTQYGLNRFDGYEFKWWTNEKNGLSSNKVHAITQDAAGRLWIADHQSKPGMPFFHISTLDLLDPETEQVSSFEEVLGKDLPIALNDIYASFRVSGPDQSIYLGTSDEARLIRYHPSIGFQIIPIERFQSFFPLFRTAQGHFWGLCDQLYLAKIDSTGAVLHAIKFEEELMHQKIAFDGTDLWVQVRGKNITSIFKKINNDTGQSIDLTREDVHLPPSLSDYGYNHLKYDAQNELIWGISHLQYATAFYPKTAFATPVNADDLSALVKESVKKVRRLYIDRTGQVWLGGDFGLSRIKLGQQQFERLLYIPEPEKPKDRFACRRILKQGQQLIVVVDGKDLQKIDLQTKEETPLGIPPSYRKTGDPTSFTVAAYNGDLLWFHGDKLYRINQNEDADTLALLGQTGHSIMVWSIYPDRNNRIWLGTGSNLLYLDPQRKNISRMEALSPFEDITGAQILDMVADPSGMVWVCSDKGLFELDPNNGIIARYWTDGPDGYQLPHNDIRHLHCDEEGIYWLATAGGGLIRWDRKNQEYQQFTRVDGLSNNSLYAVYEDQRQRLWISSDLGIMQFDKKTHHIQPFLEEDGITHNEFNRVSHFQDPETGHIYFGGLNGITAFDPESFYEDDAQLQPPLVITGFQQFNGQQNQLVDRKGKLLREQKIILHPDDRFFNLSFALLSYDKPEQILYAYQIEGWANEWEYQKERSIRLGRLPYGKHTLRVKAQAANGQWSPHLLEIPILVLKPFYLKSWFILLMGLLILLTLYGIYRYNFRRQLALQEAQQLKELDQLKTDFYTNITHEFRTPLTVIMGMVERIKGHELERSLVLRNSSNLLRLVNQLLDLAKMGSGKMNLDLQQGNIITFLQYLTESFHSEADEKQITLSFQPEQEEVIMDFDEERIQQILYNLLSNALKFTPAQGHIWLRTQSLYHKDEEHLHLEIADDGIGISEKQLPHIFDRFYQADGSTTQKKEGTGVGLALTRELVQLMRGSISVKSELHIGTTFIIMLPIQKDSNTPKRVPAPIELDKSHPVSTQAQLAPLETRLNGTEKPEVLIVEDNTDVAIYLESLLIPHYQVSKANNGQKGIDQALETIPDLIITDVMMPKKDGFELCETLKKDERTCHIPIIMLTAKATEQDRIAGLQTGADAYLMKPFNKQELFVRLEKLIALRKALQKHYVQATPSFAGVGISISDQETPSSLDEQFLQKISQVIEEKIGDTDLDIDYLCKAVHLSSTQLNRKMKALTGAPPISFIRKIRLHKARALLQTTDLTIAEIAYELGFTDPNYFSRAFGKEFGEAPSAVR